MASRAFLFSLRAICDECLAAYFAQASGKEELIVNSQDYLDCQSVVTYRRHFFNRLQTATAHQQHTCPQAVYTEWHVLSITICLHLSC